MTYFTSLKRSSALGIIAALALGFLAFAPNSFAAATLTFDPAPPTTYELYAGDYEFTVKGADVLGDTDLVVKVARADLAIYTTIDDTHKFTQFAGPFDNPHTFSWDGKLGGNYVDPGEYRVLIEGTGSVDLSRTFTVTEEAHIDITSAPDKWTMGGDNYDIDFSLQTAVPACVVLSVDGKVVDLLPSLNTDKYQLSWDGTLDGQPATVGNHNWKFDIVDDVPNCPGEAGVLDAASGTVEVIAATGVEVNNFVISPSLFSPNNDGNEDTTNISFSLPEQVTSSVTVLDGTDILKVLVSAQSLTQGDHDYDWDGKNTQGDVVADGTYTVQVLTSGDVEFSTQKNVTIDTTVEPEPETQCAGYSDVSINHPDCKAIEWVKDQGIITGNDNGKLALGDFFQRDQSVKVAGEMRGIYNDNVNYCGNSNPFPDVTGSAWSYNRVCQAKDEGIVTGYLDGTNAGKFVPGGTLNRYEAYAVLLRSIDEVMPSINTSSYGDVPTGEWFSSYAAFADQENLRSGNSFDGTDPVTRLEIIQIVYELGQLGYL